MGETATSETWVGRSVPRLEDEALLRGDGRFIDDLDPVPNAHHAAVLRSPFAHARIARLGHAPRDPDAAREDVLLRLRRDLEHGAARGLVRARREHAAGPALEQRGEDAGDLLRRLALREDRLRSALSQLAMNIDAGEAEVEIGQAGELLDGLLGARRPSAHALEELAEIIAKTGHEAIVG